MAKAMKASEQSVDVQAGAIEPSESPVVFDSSEVELAEAPITWRWARPADMAALRGCHFQSEVAAGQSLYLPDQPSDLRVIAVAEQGGKIIGGLVAEDSLVVTMIGSERKRMKNILRQRFGRLGQTGTPEPARSSFARNRVRYLFGGPEAAACVTSSMRVPLSR
jgi:hypothetical protein